jgi:hypothetical protein
MERTFADVIWRERETASVELGDRQKSDFSVSGF